VVGDRHLFGRLASRLNRSELDVNLSHSAQTAAFFTSVIRFEMVFVGLPLADGDLGELLAAFQRPGSPCADTPVLVLAPPAEAPTLARRHGGQLVEVMSAADLGPELEDRVNRRLGTGVLVAHRVGVSVTATVHAGGEAREVASSANLSESGILLRTPRPLPVGARVELELALSDGDPPLRLAAEVVRHAIPEQERLRGMGLRFVDLRDAQRQRLRRFVAERATVGG
jgi:uncharacterized protein (TIGR02266 family)